MPSWHLSENIFEVDRERLFVEITSFFLLEYDRITKLPIVLKYIFSFGHYCYYGPYLRNNVYEEKSLTMLEE